MATVKYDTSHHAGSDAAARISNRLKNSGGDRADVIVRKGDGPTRTVTNIHHSANQQPGRKGGER